jgi:hypothetical protein
MIMSALSDQHRAAIVATLPSGETMAPEAWVALEEIIVGYRSFETRRTTYPIVEERKRWERLGKAVDAAIAELCQLRQTETWTNQALAALREVHNKVESRAAFHDIWSAFGRRQNPHREFLFWGVMRVWTDHLGGELRYSMSDGIPHGPLVRFMRACIEPVLGDATPTVGIADIIERERTARDWVEAEKRRRLGG